MATDLQPACLPNTCQWTAHTQNGDYMIQVAWPMPWSKDRVPNDDEPVQTM